MKSVSSSFKNEQAKSMAVSLRRISYKRRRWVQDSQSYVWETSWTVIPESEVISVSPITAKLDTDAVNEFKISNLTINLKNDDRRWTTTNPYGRFGKDSASSIFGYEPYWTKFKIESGYTVNGVDTYTPLFVGVAVDFQTDSYTDACQINIQGLEAILKNANAENVSTLVENETPSGTVDGSNKDFVTIQPGVGIVIRATIDGIDKKVGTEYSVSNLDTPTLGATVTFATAPTAGQVVKLFYRYWSQNQSVEDLVIALLTEAGVQAGAVVENVFFAGGVSDIKYIDTLAEWSTGTNSGTSYSELPGDLKLDGNTPLYAAALFDDFSGTLSNWTETRYASTSGGVCLLTDDLVGGFVNFGYIIKSSSSMSGEWRVKMKRSALGGSKEEVIYSFIGKDRFTVSVGEFFNSYTSYLYSSYAIRYSSFSSDIELLKTDNLGVITVLGTATLSTVTAGSTFVAKVTRTLNGRMQVYADGVLKIDVTDSSITSSTNCMVSRGNRTISYSLETGVVDDVYFPATSATAEYTSGTLDFTATVGAFGTITSFGTFGDEIITYKTRTSTDGISWDAWLDASAGNAVNSTPKRYLQLGIVINHPNNGTTPVIDKTTIQYSSLNARITLAKFLGKSVYDAIQSLGSFANYEWGFKEDETFFFRPKSVTARVDETLESSKNLIDVFGIRNGYDRVYNEVQAEFGAFNVIVSSSPNVAVSALARFGKKRFSISNGDILLANDTDIASGVANNLHVYLSAPRRTCKAKTKLMEWVDLADNVLVNYVDNPNSWWIGDGHVYLGQENIWLHGPEANTLAGFLAKVVGYRHDTENKISEFDLEEILQ